jgi:predicted enzyme related to lactoylglutathione lyase
MSEHQIVHVEISSKNREESAVFYQNVFGWEVQHIPEMNYATFRTGQDEVGGGFNPVGEDYPAGTVIVYINTNDIQASLKKISECGGQVLFQPMPIPGVGLFAQFKDPSGNTLALLEPHMDQQ